MECSTARMAFPSVGWNVLVLGRSFRRSDDIARCSDGTLRRSEAFFGGRMLQSTGRIAFLPVGWHFRRSDDASFRLDWIGGRSGGLMDGEIDIYKRRRAPEKYIPTRLRGNEKKILR